MKQMTAEQALEGLLPLAEDLASALVPEAEWVYARRGPTSCELKGEPGSYQYAHRFGLSREAAPDGRLPAARDLFGRTMAWLEAEGFMLASAQEPPADDILFLSGSGKPGRVTVAAGPEKILVSIATHPLPSAKVVEPAATAEN